MLHYELRRALLIESKDFAFLLRSIGTSRYVAYLVSPVPSPNAAPVDPNVAYGYRRLTSWLRLGHRRVGYGRDRLSGLLRPMSQP